MAVAKKIAYNVVVSTASKILSTVLALVAISFITRYLGTNGFGDYAFVLTFLSFFAAAADLGLYYIATREISRQGADEEKIIGNIFTLRMFSALATLVVSPLIVWFLPYPFEVKEGIVIVVASFLFSSSYQVLNGVFQKNLAMDKVAVGEFVGKVVQVLIVIGAVHYKLSFSWIISSILINMIVSFLIVYVWAQQYTRIRLRFDWEYWKFVMRDSVPMGIASIVSIIYFKADTLILYNIKTSSEVGIYGAAYKVLENITFFPAMIAGLVMPIMAHSIFSDKKKFVDISNKTFRVFMILVVPLVVGTLFLADGVIRIIGGAGFAAAGDVLRVLVFAIAFIFFGQFFNTILVVGNMQKRLMWISAIAAIFNVGLNLIFIPAYSYTAAAWTSVATELLVVILTYWSVAKNLDYLPSYRKSFRILAAGAFMAFFLYIFKGANFFFLAISSAAIYLIFLWIFDAIESEEIASLISKKGIQEYEELP